MIRYDHNASQSSRRKVNVQSPRLTTFILCGNAPRRATYACYLQRNTYIVQPGEAKYHKNEVPSFEIACKRKRGQSSCSTAGKIKYISTRGSSYLYRNCSWGRAKLEEGIGFDSEKGNPGVLYGSVVGAPIFGGLLRVRRVCAPQMPKIGGGPSGTSTAGRPPHVRTVRQNHRQSVTCRSHCIRRIEEQCIRFHDYS